MVNKILHFLRGSAAGQCRLTWIVAVCLCHVMMKLVVDICCMVMVVMVVQAAEHSGGHRSVKTI